MLYLAINTLLLVSSPLVVSSFSINVLLHNSVRNKHGGRGFTCNDANKLVNNQYITNNNLHSIPLLSPLNTKLTNDNNEDNSTRNNNEYYDIEDEVANAFTNTDTDTDVKVRIDDGGSDLTDRFKYKVHALMGDYDPEEKTPDNDEQVGNIYNAMLTYPTTFTFTLIGKVDYSNNAEVQEFVNDIKNTAASILLSSSSSISSSTNNDNNNDLIENQDSSNSSSNNYITDSMQVTTIPRGTKFVKVSLTVMTQSSADISMIYDSLSNIDKIVMKF